MTAERCRPYRELLGVYLLGGISDEERPGLEAHLEGCAECRAELEKLEPLVRMLPLADPERVQSPVSPPAGLADRIAQEIETERRQAEAEQKQRRRVRMRWRIGWAGAAAGAVATALIAIALIGGGGGPGESSPQQRVDFASVPQGVTINASLEPRSFGTQIRMSVHGVQSGTLCRVYLKRGDGMRVPAGTFRYRYGDDAGAVLSSALDLSQARAIVVRAGPHTYTAPIQTASS
jgi:anti-sigma factor RsiW